MLELATGTVEAPCTLAERNLLLDYYELLPEIAARAGIAQEPGVDEHGEFAPGFMLPELSKATRRFFAAANVRWETLADYGGCQISLLNLMQNPATQTTKTVASLLIVARAVAYIRATGERVLIVSPTSGNKGVALRDAVWRAIDAGLVGPRDLRVAVIAPHSCAMKLRGGELGESVELRALNPLFLYAGETAEEVKSIGREVAGRLALEDVGARGLRVWSTLKLENYLPADALRAAFEQSVMPLGTAKRRRVHAHAVSSAFGLLGYTAGLEFLQDRGQISDHDRPGYLLVQHLGTPDMVLNLCHGDCDRARIPFYRANEMNGLLEQEVDLHFPFATMDAEEILDGTFYTHRPVTCEAMSSLIARYGGDGIVVSLFECLERYPAVRQRLRGLQLLPTDARQLREWSVVMAMTGVMNAIDRGLIGDCEVVVHGSGCYTDRDCVADRAAFIDVTSANEIVAQLRTNLHD